MSDLEEKLERERREKEWAETWEADGPGDRLIGVFEGVDEAETKHGRCAIAHVRTSDGVLRALWLRHTVLQNEWKESSPQVGDRVGVQYLGKREGESYPYHVWTVAVERTGEEPDDRPPQRPGEEALDGKEQAERLYDADEEAEDRPDPTLSDPDSELPY